MNILAHVYEHNKIIWGIGVLTSVMTSFYMFRLLFITFYGKFRGTEHQENHLHESPISITLPLIVLAVFSAIGGFIGLPAVSGKPNYLASFLAPIYNDAKSIRPQLFKVALDHHTEIFLMLISAGAALVSMLLAYFIYIYKKKVPVGDPEITGLTKVVYNKYYIDELYNALVVNPVNKLSFVFYSFFEKVIDGLVNGTGALVVATGGVLRKVQAGGIGSYLFYMVFGIFIILVVNYFL